MDISLHVCVWCICGDLIVDARMWTVLFSAARSPHSRRLQYWAHETVLACNSENMKVVSYIKMCVCVCVCVCMYVVYMYVMCVYICMWCVCVYM